MKRTAVQFGAGNIGRGFTAQLFHESGYEVVFVEAVPALVEEINQRKRYTIHIVGDEPQEVSITNIRALPSHDVERIAQEVSQAGIVCTAVGVNALKRVAPSLARGVALRAQNPHAPPLNILICENQINANEILQAAILEDLPTQLHSYVHSQIGFVLCVVSRMVPIMTEEEKQRDPLAIKVEAYKRLPADANAFKGEVPPVVGLEPVHNFMGYVERKLFVHNAAHATLGYLGWLKGYTYVYEAINDPQIREILEDAMHQVSEALIRKHGFSPEQQAEYLSDLFRRFQNVALGDTIARVAREPERKLRPDDRLVGAARLLMESGLDPEVLSTVIAAALLYDNAEDPSAVALQNRLQREGVSTVLETLCGIPSDTSLHQCVLQAYSELRYRLR